MSAPYYSGSLLLLTPLHLLLLQSSPACAPLLVCDRTQRNREQGVLLGVSEEE